MGVTRFPCGAQWRRSASNVAVFEQSSCGHLVIPASDRRHVPSHRVSQPIIDIEQERDFQCFLNRLLGHARTHHRAHVFGSEAAMIEGHLLEQPQRGAKPFADRRCRVLVQDLLNQEIVVESGRRDRGMRIRSKVALIHARHERGKQLALAHRPC